MVKMSLEELKKLHPPESIAPYGIVIVVPTAEWEKIDITDLKEDNKISFHDWRGKTSVFVKLPPKQPQTETQMPIPANPTPLTKAERMGNNAKSPGWTPEEENRLMKRWKELGQKTMETKSTELTKEFPGRSSKSLYQKQFVLSHRSEYQQQPIEKAKPEPTAAQPENQPIAETKKEPKQPQEETEYRATALGVIQSFTEIYTRIERRLTAAETEVAELKKTLKEHEHSLQTGKAMAPL
jgi:hypothetical protein